MIKRKLTLTQFTALFSLMLLVVGSTVVIGGLIAGQQVGLVRSAWNDLQIIKSEQAIIENRLRTAIGYGGMIHAFKNYVIRQEERYLIAARESLGAAKANVQSYRSLELSPDERQALDQVESTLNAYEQAMETAQRMIPGGSSIYVLDTMTKVSDGPALDALHFLHDINSAQIKIGQNKSLLVADLRAKLGYGGMIHAFKNYVLRGSDKFRRAVETSAQAAIQVIRDYKRFETTQAERAALKQIEQTIVAYQSKLDHIKQSLAQAQSTEQIDRTIKIDDQPALRAFNILEEEISAEIVLKTQEVDQVLGRVESLGGWIVVIAGVGLLVVLTLTVWVLRYVITDPVRNMTAIMTGLSKGNFETPIPENHMVCEIDEMTKAAVIFRENAIARMTADLEIATAHKWITESVRYASRIQQSLLPPDARMQESFADAFILWEPRDLVGGDLYWLRADKRGVMLAVFDCTGHGVPGALMTTIAISALERGYAATTDPGRLIRLVNQQIKSALKQNGKEGLSDDGLEIGICLVETARGKLTYAGARFELLTIHNGDFEIFKGTKAGVGYRKTPFDQKFDTVSVKVEPGKSFYLFSDGIVDQVGGEKNRAFGKKRLREALLSFEDLPMETQGNALQKTLENFQGTQSRRDDVTVLGFKPLR